MDIIEKFRMDIHKCYWVPVATQVLGGIFSHFTHVSAAYIYTLFARLFLHLKHSGPQHGRWLWRVPYMHHTISSSCFHLGNMNLTPPWIPMGTWPIHTYESHWIQLVENTYFLSPHICLMGVKARYQGIRSLVLS